MFGISGRKIQPIGLDIGHSRIKMIQLGLVGDKLSVIAAENAPVDQSLESEPEKYRDSIVSSVRQMFLRGNFHGNRVVASLPADVVSVKNIRIDDISPEEIPARLTEEARIRYSVKPETHELDYMAAGQVRQGDELKQEILLFSAEKKGIESHIQLIEQCGLEPAGLDPLCCAIYRSSLRTLRREEDNETVSVLIDVGSRFTNVVVGRGQDVTFVKKIPFGGNRFDSEVSSRLDIDLDQARLLRKKLSAGGSDDVVDKNAANVVNDAIQYVVYDLVREISLCFRYYAVTFRGQKPSRVLFSGGEAGESMLQEVLMQRLGIKVQHAQPLLGVSLDDAGIRKETDKNFGLWTVATGLSLKGYDFSREVA